MLDIYRRRAWRHAADLRRVITRSGSARPALAVFEDVDRSDAATWHATTDAEHERYRGLIDPIDDDVAIVCVSNRPHLLADVIANVERQQQGRLEFVYVDNSGSKDHRSMAARLDEAFSGRTRSSFLTRAPNVSLGSCLNAAMRRTEARFVAKFDDDDLYGPDYLLDALRAHRYAGAGVVGKHTYYGHLTETDEYVLRFPGHEFSYTSTLAGGTLLIDRQRVGDLSFRDISLGEDRAFIADCHRRGVSTFSADRFGFLQARGADNTWASDRTSYLAKSRIVSRVEATARLRLDETGPSRA
ncbi:MAG: glycosyltransferase family A protein [Acidimicrobiia bacterium]|nr:glycosyltransferase family A protein [Acidimicrobiia bacterium]